jgi:hypothetical protein
MTRTGVVVLLTACVHPGDVVGLARRDPATRLDDYRTALKRWLQVRSIDAIVLCENSGADVSMLRREVEAAPAGSPPVEIIVFEGQTFDPRLGKGFGEMGIIQHALERSAHLAGARIVLKATGRLFVTNAGRIARTIGQADGIDVFCDLRRNLATADSRVFAATPRFLREHLVPLRSMIDDSAGVCFEDALARAVHGAMAQGARYAPLPRAHRLVGIAGTNNQRIPDGFFDHLRREVFGRVKAFVLSR